jgi:2-polyprenyl-3-methyl-5-hydroxy-6-metoxy-1,4-benzoquinol methylase
MICGSDAIDRHCRKPPATYYRCQACSFIFQHPAPVPEDFHAYADTEYEAGGLYREYVRAKPMKLEHFRRRLTAIQTHLPKGRLLDVGSSCGYFLEVAAEAGYDVQGLEFSKNAIAAAAPHIQPRISRARVDEIAGEREGSYDVITAFDIIEHLERPLVFLAQARRLLGRDGRLVLSTPDASHWLRYVMGARWPMLQPMQHVSLFSGQALRMALTNTGFRTTILGPAHKVLSWEYLIGQVSALNPLLHSTLNRATRLIPRRTMQAWRDINIGELLVIAAKAD